MKQHYIASMPGDFIGKEVVAEEWRVLEAVAQKYGFSFKVTHYPHSGEHFLKTGELLPDSVIRELKDHEAIAFGAVGHPEVEKRNVSVEQGILLKMRFDMGQYINLRPSKLYKGVDTPIRRIHPDLPNGYELIVVREGTGDLYKGKGSIETLPDGTIIAQQIMDYNSQEVDRAVRYAFELAREKGKETGGKPFPVTLGFKSNVLEYVSRGLWQPRFQQIAKEEYPDVPSNYGHIDAIAGPWLISQLQKEPWILLTGNMFGDIITDEITELFGGMGGGPSACINPKGTSMFEPIHGSSPKDYGKNNVSSIAAILAGALMLKNIGEKEAAKGLEAAVERVLAQGKIPNFTINSGVSTTQQTQYVLEELARV